VLKKNGSKSEIEKLDPALIKIINEKFGFDKVTKV
jgi:hypothetical protein